MANDKQLDKLLDEINSQINDSSSQIKQLQDSIIKRVLNRIHPEFAFIEDIEGGKLLYNENTITFSLNYLVEDLTIPCAVKVELLQDNIEKIVISPSEYGIVILIPTKLFELFKADVTDFVIIKHKLEKDTLVKFNNLTGKITQELQDTFHHIVLELENKVRTNSKRIASKVIENYFPEFNDEIQAGKRAINSSISFKREVTNKLLVPNIESLEVGDPVRVSFVKGQHIIITATMSTEVLS